MNRSPDGPKDKTPRKRQSFEQAAESTFEQYDGALRRLADIPQNELDAAISRLRPRYKDMLKNLAGKIEDPD